MQSSTLMKTTCSHNACGVSRKFLVRLPHPFTSRSFSQAVRPHLRPAALPPLADIHIDHQTLADIADAAAAASKKSDLISLISDGLEGVLKRLQDGLQTVHVPYSYGFSIILLTMIVKIVTFPLTKKQVESSMAVQKLKPRIDLIKARYGDDKEKVQRETSLLYEKAGVDPLAGCLPSVATIPIFIGLYRSLTNVASEGLLDTEGFFWIPNLAGPTSVAARQAGSGTAWLLPFVDGHPPIGWDEASAYLVLPVLLVIVQYISTAIVSPPINPEDQNATTQKVLYTALPLMVGWFSLNVPSGLSLYYFSNTVLTSLTQIWLKKLGGADVQINDLGPVTKLGAGRRTGEPVLEPELWTSSVLAAAKAAEGADESQKAAAATAAAALAAPSSSNDSISKRCKRKKVVQVA